MLARRKFVITLATVLLLILCGCGDNSQGSDTDATITELEQEIVELQERISELEEENKILRSGNGNTIFDNTSNDLDNAENAPTTITLNAPIAVGEVMEITLTGAEWTDSILPSNTSKSYSYKGDREDETFFVVRGTITSSAGSPFGIGACTDSSITINDKYNFSAEMEFEDADGAGFGDTIKPLQTRNFILYSSVSDGVYDIRESVEVNFAVPNNEEELGYYYDEDHSNTKYTITFDNLQT